MSGDRVELEVTRGVVEEYATIVAEQTRRIRALVAFGEKLAGVVGTELPLGDYRSEILNEARVTLWPDKWQYDRDGKTAVPRQ